MSDLEALRRDIVAMVDELRHTVAEIGDQDVPQTHVVSNARDRLRYISSLTEQAAGQTLNSAEAIGERLRAQRQRAAELVGVTRSEPVREFLRGLVDEHEQSAADVSEIIQAQAFQDLVGQVVGKLMNMVQHLEDSLVHLLVEEEEAPSQLAGPAVTAQEQVSQADVDDLFG